MEINDIERMNSEEMASWMAASLQNGITTESWICESKTYLTSTTR